MQETAKTDTAPVPSPERLPNGQFPAGVSGNPAGRTKGTKNAITLARLMLEETLRESLTKAGPKLMHKAIRMALKGDDKIMRVLLDKMLATPRGDDSGDATERDIQIIIQNLTGPAPKLVSDDKVVSVQFPSRGSQKVSKESNQYGPDNVPTLTSKSSGLSPLLANIEPRQDAKVEKREPSTENDKA